MTSSNEAAADMATRREAADPAGAARPVLLGASLVLIALNLRLLFTGLSAVLPEIMRDLAIPPSVASLMTTLPVLCLGLFAPMAPRLAGRLGSERTILVLLVVLALGTALRGLATMPAILLGSVMAGGAIAIVNVLLPGLVKRDFPRHTALMTGLYTTAICASGAFGAGATVPLADAVGGWAGALALWGVPPLVIALLWVPQARAAGRPLAGTRGTARGLWRDPLAWQVTLYMGFQSALAYCIFAWLSPLLRERGLDARHAGFMVSLAIFAQMAASLTAPAIATRRPDQRGIAVFVVVAAVAGFAGLAVGPREAAWAFALLQGIGQGGALAIAMTLIILRAPDSRVAAQLSGMAQGVGYTLAAVGPLVMGLIRERTGGFAATVWLLAGLGLAGCVAALGAGRRVQLAR